MFELSATGKETVYKELKRYEDIHSAIIPSLFCAQKENGGYISVEVIEHLSELMKIPTARINEVFYFYTMFNKKPVGKYHVQVCCNISCAMNGAREFTEELCERLAVAVDGVSEDNRYTVSKVECLGSCDGAPMMQVNDNYYENLTVDSAVKLLKEMP